ncbi:MAG TPA: hypothetical protein VN380_17230, partial [Thermoanaerobaculia bacterium]|nr:hypothetical protein [Thermoanaerobaculia bacterium]
MGDFRDDQYTTWAAIQRLRVIWEENHSSVAAGALNAIAGFDYQFVIALRDTVKRWLGEDHGLRREPAVFTEILSDVLDVAAEGPVHVTQVKRTQSGPTVRAALEDLWLIYRLASATEPVLSEIMGYRVASARSKIRDVHDILSTWKPIDVEESDPALQDFRLRVSIEIDADPESELLTLLANECRADEPLADVHRWLGRLVHAASTPRGFLTAGKEIWNDLYALSASADRNKARSSIYLWQHDDHPPEEVQAGSYLTGERPLPRHLRLGFFAPREAVLRPLSAKIIEWLTPHPASNDDSLRLPVFWIGGRSGTGKSVALLQILSLIHAEQIGPILWLGPHTAALADAIRWAQKLRRHGETVVIGVDDPYAPVAQNDAIALWQQAISGMITTRQGDDPTELPVLICCGPTEQAERFEKELSDDICLTREDLPQEKSEDHALLRRWFRARTGHESPEIGDGDVLLVQLFFEWKVGAPLQAFANRLRQRIATAETREHKRELTDQFSRILALNRLYVGYPRGAVERTLTPDQKSVFLRLQRENHLVADPDDARPGIWLAHPHLSNAIYTAWHSGSAAEPVRRDHLREGVLSAIEYGNNPNQQQSPLWAISRALDNTLDDSTIADRLAGEELVPLLQDIHRTLLEQYGGKLPLIQLPVWIEIRSLRPEIWLDPDPVEAGIAALLRAATGEAGLSLTCQKLLQHLTRHPEEVCKRIEDATIHLLQRTTEWREWISIMLDALRWCRRPEIGSIMVDWVDDHRSHVMVPVLLNLGIQHASGTEIQEKAVRELGLRYVETTPFDHGSWTFIWEALENATPGDTQLRELGFRWLATVSPDRGSWAYVWTALDKATPGDTQLRELGLRWLATAPDRGSWAYVWTALDKATPGDTQL